MLWVAHGLFTLHMPRVFFRKRLTRQGNDRVWQVAIMASNIAVLSARRRCCIVVVALLSVCQPSTEQGNTRRSAIAERLRDASCHYFERVEFRRVSCTATSTLGSGTSWLYWRRQLWCTGARPPSTYNNLLFFSVLWPIQSLTATICRQSPPVKTQ